MESISAIIVDDEPLAREGLATRLHALDDFSVIEQCEDGQTALVCIEKMQPDVVFLDINMPGINGMELFELLIESTLPTPNVVFVTAFSDFAIKAFDNKACDYLLKPYSEDRLDACLDRVRTEVSAKKILAMHLKFTQLLSTRTGKSLDCFMQTLEHSPQISLQDLKQTISVKCGTQWLRIKLQSISWIEAAGDYMCVHTAEGTHIIRKTLRQFETELAVESFLRINRSTIVNLSKITQLTPNSNGEYIAKLDTGDELKVSRKYKLKLAELNIKN
ncbi:LytR/AlgR family response regulator transcription factor [Aliiglaciecola lipolytica]|uniref:Response regulator receiver protein n=1 Tax=Aliiglaciecola lipolytica E3 TaxID=1127673 RepID=K6X5V9_9ALTE|nr:LytTR family DNA-binding domain-containing protein [Aliiglaciecola lipolytica]GAC15999.1 response regulator receiver protein [Aliiglaciecola lipolytica E3]